MSLIAFVNESRFRTKINYSEKTPKLTKHLPAKKLIFTIINQKKVLCYQNTPKINLKKLPFTKRNQNLCITKAVVPKQTKIV